MTQQAKPTEEMQKPDAHLAAPLESAVQGLDAAPAPRYWCNKCGYHGPLQIAHQRPNGSGECGYIARPFANDETQRVAEALDAMKAEAVDQNIAEGKMSRIVWEAQASLINPCTQVYFRAGLIACREYMARFVEAESPSIAASIRANWWPQLGEDFGGPRLLDFSEVADGGEEGPWTAKPVSPTLEALPLALNFLVPISRAGEA